MEISIKSNKKNELIDITLKVEELIKRSGIKKGLCNICCPHTTAGLIINENADPSVQKDILMKLNNIVTEDPEYVHSEGNSAAHVKSSVVGVSLNVPVEDGKLILGTWQGIYFAEFDGPRSRKVIVNFY